LESNVTENQNNERQESQCKAERYEQILSFSKAALNTLVYGFDEFLSIFIPDLLEVISMVNLLAGQLVI